ncbi:MAG TPA: PE-PPE domain-containing protein, partial [Mycobacterium sp.]|nr:PE-PPE domain-containing protein [Mycobacterium sp.]
VAATDLSTVPADHISTATNTKGGSVTTVLAPTRNLPLTQPLRDLGVPGALVDRADRVLRPVIDSGYRRHDRPGDSRPYLYDGQIRRDAAATNPLRQLRSAADERADKQAAEPAAAPRALVRRIRAGLREKVAAGLHPSPRKPAGPQPARRPADGGDGTPS